MRYQLTYKCRLCGKQLLVGDPVNMTCDEIKGLAPSHNFSKEYTHLCDDGGYGVAVYAGYRLTDFNYEVLQDL